MAFLQYVGVLAIAYVLVATIIKCIDLDKALTKNRHKDARVYEARRKG